MFLIIDTAALSIQLALRSRSLLRREFAAGLASSGRIQIDPSFLSPEPRRLTPRKLAALNPLSNSLSLILLSLADCFLR